MEPRFTVHYDTVRDAFGNSFERIIIRDGRLGARIIIDGLEDGRNFYQLVQEIAAKHPKITEV